MPPRLPPMTAASCPMPRMSSSRAWASTQSSTVTTGKSAPQGWPVAGLVWVGPVLPKQEPMLFTPITNQRFVSTALPGPIMLCHHPSLRAIGWPRSSACSPATWWLAFRAWQISTALDRSALRVP